MSEDFVKEMICTVCPVGCRLTVKSENGELTVSGNACPRGAVYGREELTHPVRVLTTTVPLRGGAIDLLPVRTCAPIPKEKLAEAMRLINRARAEAPVRCGQIILPDLLGLGVDVVASRDAAAL